LGGDKDEMTMEVPAGQSLPEVDGGVAPGGEDIGTSKGDSSLQLSAASSAITLDFSSTTDVLSRVVPLITPHTTRGSHHAAMSSERPEFPAPGEAIFPILNFGREFCRELLILFLKSR
jgi:hypothetical protein